MSFLNYDCFQYRYPSVSLTGAWLRLLCERRKEYEAEINSTTGCYTVDDDRDL